MQVARPQNLLDILELEIDYLEHCVDNPFGECRVREIVNCNLMNKYRESCHVVQQRFLIKRMKQMPAHKIYRRNQPSLRRFFIDRASCRLINSETKYFLAH